MILGKDRGHDTPEAGRAKVAEHRHRGGGRDTMTAEGGVRVEPVAVASSEAMWRSRERYSTLMRPVAAQRTQIGRPSKWATKHHWPVSSRERISAPSAPGTSRA